MEGKDESYASLWLRFTRYIYYRKKLDNIRLCTREGAYVSAPGCSNAFEGTYELRTPPEPGTDL